MQSPSGHCGVSGNCAIKVITVSDVRRTQWYGTSEKGRLTLMELISIKQPVGPHILGGVCCSACACKSSQLCKQFYINLCYRNTKNRKRASQSLSLFSALQCKVVMILDQWPSVFSYGFISLILSRFAVALFHPQALVYHPSFSYYVSSLYCFSSVCVSNSHVKVLVPVFAASCHTLIITLPHVVVFSLLPLSCLFVITSSGAPTCCLFLHYLSVYLFSRTPRVLRQTLCIVFVSVPTCVPVILPVFAQCGFCQCSSWIVEASFQP